MVSIDPNPYQSPHAPNQPQPAEDVQPRNVGLSVFMILSGAFFCVASFYVLFGHGIDSLLSSYRSLGWFPTLFMFFYGFAGGLTAMSHLLYLLRGWPRQPVAGVYAMIVALALAGVAAAILSLMT